MANQKKDGHLHSEEQNGAPRRTQTDVIEWMSISKEKIPSREQLVSQGGDAEKQRQRAQKFQSVTITSEVAQSCPTLCDPVDYSLPSSSVHGILQARILEWVAIKTSPILTCCRSSNPPEPSLLSSDSMLIRYIEGKKNLSGPRIMAVPSHYKQ